MHPVSGIGKQAPGYQHDMGRLAGTSRNQDGSEVVLDDTSVGRLSGTFWTAVDSSPLTACTPKGRVCTKEQRWPSCVQPAVATSLCPPPESSMNGQLETLWSDVDGSAFWWTSMTISHDTFSRSTLASI